MNEIVLPKLVQYRSPNFSSRLTPVRGVCAHRWAVPPQTTTIGATSTYHGVVRDLCNPDTQASAHVVYGGSLVDEATQLVPWGKKSWACKFYNSLTDNIEFADAIWSGDDPEGFKVAARIVAFRCHIRDIPPVWTKNPGVKKGVCRHYDLGILGGGHTDPTTDDKVWTEFMKLVVQEFNRGGFRREWGI